MAFHGHAVAAVQDATVPQISWTPDSNAIVTRDSTNRVFYSRVRNGNSRSVLLATITEAVEHVRDLMQWLA